MFTIFRLTSTIVVTATLARRAAEHPELVHSLDSGIIVACSIMPIRVLVLVGVISPALLPTVLPEMLTFASLLHLLMTIEYIKRVQTHSAEPILDLYNPLDIITIDAAALGLIIATVTNSLVKSIIAT